MASKIVDKIDPFKNKALIKSRKQKRSQGSSHYRTQGSSELQALPQLKGKNLRLVVLAQLLSVTKIYEYRSSQWCSQGGLGVKPLWLADQIFILSCIIIHKVSLY